MENTEQNVSVPSDAPTAPAESPTAAKKPRLIKKAKAPKVPKEAEAKAEAKPDVPTCGCGIALASHVRAGALITCAEAKTYGLAFDSLTGDVRVLDSKIADTRTKLDAFLADRNDKYRQLMELQGTPIRNSAMVQRVPMAGGSSMPAQQNGHAVPSRVRSVYQMYQAIPVADHRVPVSAATLPVYEAFLAHENGQASARDISAYLGITMQQANSKIYNLQGTNHVVKIV